MSAKQQHNNILLAIIGFVAVVVIVAVIGFFTLGRTPDDIQGEVEVTEYRVSSKVPGRILELRVKEGDYVKVGDTLAILDAPEVRAKAQQARSAEDAAAAATEAQGKIDELIDIDVDVLGYLDPGVSVNTIKDGKIVSKFNPVLPGGKNGFAFGEPEAGRGVFSGSDFGFILEPC